MPGTRTSISWSLAVWHLGWMMHRQGQVEMWYDETSQLLLWNRMCWENGSHFEAGGIQINISSSKFATISIHKFPKFVDYSKEIVGQEVDDIQAGCGLLRWDRCHLRWVWTASWLQSMFLGSSKSDPIWWPTYVYNLYIIDSRCAFLTCWLLTCGKVVWQSCEAHLIASAAMLDMSKATVDANNSRFLDQIDTWQLA